MFIFDTLIRNMPLKPKRMPMIKNYLAQSEITKQPDFRELSTIIEYWKDKGYTEDPAKFNIPKYKELTFDNITDFYDKNLKNKPIVTIIVTNKKRVSSKDLKKYGEIIILKENDLFKKYG